MLLAAGANVDLCDQMTLSTYVSASAGEPARRTTPLLAASFAGHGGVVRLLCRHGACVNKADAYGRTPLMAAVEASRRNGRRALDCARYLTVIMRADVDRADLYASTALSIAERNAEADGATVRQHDLDLEVGT